MGEYGLKALILVLLVCAHSSAAQPISAPTPTTMAASVNPGEPATLSGTASVEPPDLETSQGRLQLVDPMDILNYSKYGNRLVSFHQNYGAIASDHGENRLQFQLSLKYELLQYPSAWWNQNWLLRPTGFYLAYDGLYDFYWFTRPSSPVISRDQNPGGFIHFVPSKNERLYDMDYLDAGWFHESNGQTTVNDTQYQQIEAELGQNAAQDSVHRGWDYWYLGSEFVYFPFDKPEFGDNPGKITRPHLVFVFQPSLRLYDGHQGIAGPVSENIFWKPVSTQPYIYDYDGIRATFVCGLILPDATFLHFNAVALIADVRTGYNYGYFADNWSKRINLMFKTGYFPWYFYYTNGYGPYISDYTTWSQGWGVGVRLL